VKFNFLFYFYLLICTFFMAPSSFANGWPEVISSCDNIESVKIYRAHIQSIFHMELIRTYVTVVKFDKDYTEKLNILQKAPYGTKQLFTKENYKKQGIVNHQIVKLLTKGQNLSLTRFRLITPINTYDNEILDCDVLGDGYVSLCRLSKEEALEIGKSVCADKFDEQIIEISPKK